MKRITLLLLFFFFLSSKGVFSQKVKFETAAWSKILEKSKKENKPIFVDFYATWCGPCKELEKNVYTDKKVGKYMNKQFVNVKIDAENQEPDLVKQAGVDSYPTLIYYNSSGEEILRFVGYRDSEEFLEEAAQALEESKLPTLANLEKSYLNGDRSEELLENYLKKRLRQNPQRVDNGEILDAYFTKKNNQINDNIKVLFMDNLRSVRFKSPGYAFLEKNANELRNIYPDAEIKSSDEYLKSINTFIAFADIERAIITKNNTSIDAAVAEFLKYTKVNKYYYMDPLWSVNELLKPYYLENDKAKFVDYASAYLQKRYGTTQSKSEILSKFSSVYDYYFKNVTFEDLDSTANLDSQKKSLSENQLFSYLSEDLNSTAWAVFENTEDIQVLKKMLPFAKLSVHLTESYYNIDTYAQLLFKTGSKKEALYLEKKAIRLATYYGDEGQIESLTKSFEEFEKEVVLPAIKPMATDKATLENHLERYNHYNMVLDYDKVLEFMPEELFKISPKEKVKEALETAFNTPQLFVNIEEVKMEIGPKIITENNVSYAKIKMHMIMVLDINKMVQGENNTAETKKSIIDNISSSYYAMYGKDKTVFDPLKNTFRISNTTAAFAIGDKSKSTWKFINDEASLKGVLNSILSEKVREKLN